MHLAVTAHPTAARVWRQLLEATPWSQRPKHLIRDRDAVYGGDFRLRATALGIETVLTPVRAPRADAVAERAIGTLRRECLDHVIPLEEAHLRAILADFADDYNQERPRRTLHLEMPQRAAPSPTGAVHARPVLGDAPRLRTCRVNDG
jgi:transposase InsO family protein